MDYETLYNDLLEKCERLEKGNSYEDYLALRLIHYGLPLITLKSAKYQAIGENLNGIEIKFDDGYKKTNNLYFETHGRWDKGWSERGLLKQDNTYLWLIGDYSRAFLIAKNQLVSLYKNTLQYENRGIKMTCTNRSKGILIPIDFLRKHNLIIKEFNLNEIQETTT